MRLRSAVALVCLALAAVFAPLAAPLSALAQAAAAPAGGQDTFVAPPPPGSPAATYDSAPLPINREQPEAAEKAEGRLMARIDAVMGSVNGVIGAFFFYDVLFWDDEHVLPFLVLWLVIGSLFLTFRMGFINLRAFGHAIAVTRGKYTNPNAAGEVSHFAALTTALSATVGLGNIGGVAVAVSVGGPGATFWMIIAGLLGMSAKFAECTLGQMYRETRPDGSVLGGGMQYLSRGFAERGMTGVGKVLAVMFAVLCVGGSLGGGTSYQVNQSLNAIQETIPQLAAAPWAYGLLMSFLVGIVIIGGIRRIANVADKVVPLMCGVYVLTALYILLMNFTAIPAAFGTIISSAFAPDAAYGGFLGALVVGFRRAAFSNEAGTGSAAIAHSAAKTEYPVREGIVALLEPFIDTVVVCTMTALVIVITGAYNDPANAELIAANKGAALTSRAMGSQVSWFPYILSGAVFLFAYSTAISWSYYGERCWVWMFGDAASKYYKALVLVFVFLGSIITATNILDFGDLMILGMAFPNLIGVYLLSGKVKRALDDYWAKLKSGEIRRYDAHAVAGD